MKQLVPEKTHGSHVHQRTTIRRAFDPEGIGSGIILGKVPLPKDPAGGIQTFHTHKAQVVHGILQVENAEETAVRCSIYRNIARIADGHAVHVLVP